MMYDPDAPKPFIHWVISLNGKEIIPYYPPSPPDKTGLHRYVFCLISSIPSTRIQIPLTKSLFYFTSKFSGGTRKRSKHNRKN